MVLHAVTSRPMMTKYDPWVNMLRTCVAAFAAGVGWRRRRHGAAVRLAARAARRVQPPDRPQHLLPAGRGVPRRQGRRPGRRRVRRREAHRRPRGRRLGGARPDRGSRGSRRRARGRLAPRRIDEVVAERDQQIAHAQAAADRAHRVPEPARDAARAGAVRRGRAGRPPLRRGLREAPRRARRGPRSSWRPWAPSPRTPLAPPSRPTCSPPVASTWSTRAGTTTSTRCSPTTTGSRSCAWSVTTRRTPSGVPTS